MQRAITNNLTMDVAYVGNHGFALGSEADINQPAIGAGWDASAVTACLNSAPGGFNNCNPDTNAEVAAQPYFSKFPYLSQIAELANRDFSNYNSLQLTVNERTSHGLSFLAGYTYSHALDEESSSSISQGVFPLDIYDPRLDYGSTNSDIRHRFTFSPTYLIPGMKSPGQMLEGWTLSGILTMQSGLPWYPVDGNTDLTGTGEVNASSAGVQTWNYTGPTSAFTSGPTSIPCFGTAGCSNTAIPQACVQAAEAPYGGNPTLTQLALASLTNLGCYVQNGGILTPPAYGTIGNASRNLFRSPNYYNVDFSVSKLWRFKERFSAQFRVEFFNLFNRADFSIPGSGGTQAAGGINPTGGQFGCSCLTPDNANPVLGSGGPRHVQFGLKLTY
jgi:hypothetical protein